MGHDASVTVLTKFVLMGLTLQVGEGEGSEKCQYYRYVIYIERLLRNYGQ